MEKSQEGIVLAVNGDMAKVKVARHSSCENCGSCPGNSAVVVDAKNMAQAKPGQRVLIQIKEVNMLKAAFIVYMLPLIGIFVGAAAGSYLADYLLSPVLSFQIAGGVAGFALTVFYIWFFDRRSRQDMAMQPVVIRILSL